MDLPSTKHGDILELVITNRRLFSNIEECDNLLCLIMQFLVSQFMKSSSINEIQIV